MGAEPVVVEVVYARPDVQRLVTLTVEPGTTARDALRLSGLGAQFPEIDMERCPLGIFGRVVAEDQLLRAGDRVEIYRPLVHEPKEARRRQVEAQRLAARRQRGSGGI